ncbi:MAG: hypothetical protein CSB16_02000 [Clostridiales bacterium]|nr:MAG: hypothetical protein CSB16_02000 [Clostridiales bacterium]
MKKLIVLILFSTLLLVACNNAGATDESGVDYENKDNNEKVETTALVSKDDGDKKDFFKKVDSENIDFYATASVERLFTFSDPKFTYNYFDNVFIGTVTEVREGINIIPGVRHDISNKLIRTPVVIKIEKVFKGNYKSEDKVEALLFGGVMRLDKYYANFTEIDFKGRKDEIFSRYTEEELKTKYAKFTFDDITILEAGKTYLLYSNNSDKSKVLTDNAALKEVDLKSGELFSYDGIKVKENLDEFAEKYFVEDEEIKKEIESRLNYSD